MINCSNPILVSLVILFLFVLHELEEILFLEKWLDKHADDLTNRFPRLATRAIRQFRKISAKGFALIACQETIVLLFLLSYGWVTERPDFLLGIVCMLLLHWGLTLIQSAVLGRVIPGTITAMAGSSFCIYVLWNSANIVPVISFLKWGVLLFVFAMVNLWVMHLLVGNFIQRCRVK